MSLLNEQLNSGFEAARELGMAAADFTAQTLDQNCPAHQAPLIRERARSINGWFEAISCTSSDGTCAFDKSASVAIPVDGPSLYED